jgi:biopolymer transport protein ExbB
VSGFFEFIIRGGPAMIGLSACSLVAIAVVVERLLFYAQQHVDAEKLVAQVGRRIEADDLPGALAVCEQNKGMLPKILRIGLLRVGKDRGEVTDAMSVVLRKNVRALERNLSVIGTIAVIAPFVGLFGTVLGIIHAFDDIALKGNSSPAVVAAGVGEALVTTAAGLFVAVLSVISFNYFKTRAKSYAAELVDAAEELAEMMYFHRLGESIPPDLFVRDGAQKATAASG